MDHRDRGLAGVIAAGAVNPTQRRRIADGDLTLFIRDLGAEAPVRIAYEYWQSISRAGALPRRAAIDPVELGSRVLPHVILIDVEPDFRFRYRLIGNAVLQIFGVNYTGRYIDELGLGAVFDEIIAFYRHVCERRNPVLLDGTYERNYRRQFHFRRLAMPLQNEAGEIDSLFCIFEQTGRQ